MGESGQEGCHAGKNLKCMDYDIIVQSIIEKLKKEESAKDNLARELKNDE